VVVLGADHVNTVRQQLARKQAGLLSQSDPGPELAERDDQGADVEMETQPIAYEDGEEEAIDPAGDEPDQMPLDPGPGTELAKDSDQEDEQSTQHSDEPSTQNSDECKHSTLQVDPSEELD
jgi:hypothetical protein